MTSFLAWRSKEQERLDFTATCTIEDGSLWLVEHGGGRGVEPKRKVTSDHFLTIEKTQAGRESSHEVVRLVTCGIKREWLL